MFNGEKLMIIELGKYNSAEELFTIGLELQGRRDTYAIGWDQRISGTRVAVSWREGAGMQQGTGVHTMVSESGMRTGTHRNTAEQSKKVFAHNKIEID